jgi:hypothetical protein
MKAISKFARVDVSALAAQIEAIPISEWPKMVDPDSLGLGDAVRAVAVVLKSHFPGCIYSGIGLFLLVPGQAHPAHTDVQPPEWVTRVHVPVITNDKATATTDDGTIHMRAGVAYRFDTRRMHAVRNDGDAPRVHLVFDMRKA